MNADRDGNGAGTGSTGSTGSGSGGCGCDSARPDLVMIKQILDVGAEGAIVPWVNTPEEARRAVAAARYPPQGVRGYGPRRASRLSASPAEYVRRANEEILVIGQIETATAVENLD